MLERFAADLADVQGAQVAESLGGLVSEVDKASLTGAFADYLATSFRRSVSAGIGGWRGYEYWVAQKAAVAGVPVLCAISAPSSLAVEAAERLGVTVVRLPPWRELQRLFPSRTHRPGHRA